MTCIVRPAGGGGALREQKPPMLGYVMIQPGASAGAERPLLTRRLWITDRAAMREAPQ